MNQKLLKAAQESNSRFLGTSQVDTTGLSENQENLSSQIRDAMEALIPNISSGKGTTNSALIAGRLRREGEVDMLISVMEGAIKAPFEANELQKKLAALITLKRVRASGS